MLRPSQLNLESWEINTKINQTIILHNNIQRLERFCNNSHFSLIENEYHFYLIFKFSDLRKNILNIIITPVERNKSSLTVCQKHQYL